MRTLRSVEAILHDLETATALRAQMSSAKHTDQLVQMLDQDNDRDIAALELELRAAMSADLEVAIEGFAVEEHTISVPYFQRLLEQIQSVYRSMRRSLLAEGERLGYVDSTLVLEGTAPGSFRAFLRAPGQMELLDEAPADQALSTMLRLIGSASDGSLEDVVVPWRDRAEDRSLRAMVRLASTLAGSRGSISFRSRSARGVEHRVALSADEARQLTEVLVGGPGVEVVVVSGHLEMAQEHPLRIRIRAADDEYTAAAPSESVELIRDLLFTDVTVTLRVEMRTSPATGAPTQIVTLLGLQPAG